MDIARLIETRSASEIITCNADMPLRDVVALLAARRIGALPVMDGGKVVGIISERDVIYRLGAEGHSCLDRRVGEVMTASVIGVARSTKVVEALALMTRRRIRHLPIVEGEAMLGFISIGDLVKSRIDEVESEANAMRDYIQSA